MLAFTGFASPAMVATLGGPPSDIAVGDINSDGFLDFAAARGQQNRVPLFLGNGTGNPPLQQLLWPQGQSPGFVRLVDLNSDGKLDVVVKDEGGICLFVQNQNGMFAERGVYRPLWDTILLPWAIADFNADGYPDIAVGEAEPIPPNLSRPVIRILVNQGGPGTSFTVAQTLYTANMGDNSANFLDLASLDAKDINGDGKTDIVLATNNNALITFTGNGDGTFAIADLGPGSVEGFRGLKLRDVNKDQRPDLVVASATNNAVVVRLNNGIGAFGPATNYSVGTTPVATDVGDVDGDGNQDIVSANKISKTITLLRGLGNGQFVNAGNFSAGTQPSVTEPSDVELGDVNNDGFLDVVVGHSKVAPNSSTDFSILLGQGNATNSAPILRSDVSPTLSSVWEDSTNPVGDSVTSIVVDGSITDADGAVEAIAVIGADNANGVWQFLTNNGASWTNLGSPSVTQALLLGPNSKLRFVPAMNFHGTATFTFRAWDQFSGEIGGVADTTQNGGSSAYSTVTDTAQITVAPVVTNSPLVVTTTADHDDGSCSVGDCTLREAIAVANAQAGDDTINFASGVTGTINLTGPLPDLSSNIIVNGPGARVLNIRRDTGGDYRIFTVAAGATVSLSRLAISNGRTPGGAGGGGITNNGVLTVGESYIFQNTAGTGPLLGLGGGILNDANAILMIVNSTVSQNTSERVGGGITNFGGGMVTIINSTISGNASRDANGGGISNSGTLVVESSTIYGNQAVSQGGGIDTLGSASTTLRNTIVAGNVAVSGPGPDLSGVVVSQDYNLIENTSGTTINGTSGHNIYSQSPMLGPLQFNLAFTGTLTHALLPGSPAIDAGSPGQLTKDQRGFSRVLNAGSQADIGAFELGVGHFAGVAFEDSNGNGTFDAGEQGIAGRTIVVDSNRNGHIDDKDRRVMSGNGGVYELQNLSEGTYLVAQLTPVGWQPTAPRVMKITEDASAPNPSNGYHSQLAPSADTTRWVQVDLGQAYPLDQITMFPARPTDFPDTPGFGFPVRFKVEASNDPDFVNATIIADFTAADFENPGNEPVTIARAPGSTITGRYVRVTATRLSNPNGFLFALGELQVWNGGVNRALGQPVTARDWDESGLWGRARLVDGYSSRHPLQATAGAGQQLVPISSGFSFPNVNFGSQIASPVPEIDVTWNNQPIADNDTTPSTADGTDFGSVTQGGTAPTRTFTVHNFGTAPLTLENVTVPAGFTITEELSQSIARDSSDTFKVRLDTATVGTKSGEISFSTNDSDENPFNFSVTGRVTAPTSADAVITFGSVTTAPGTTNVSVAVLIAGGANISAITMPTIIGAGPGSESIEVIGLDLSGSIWEGRNPSSSITPDSRAGGAVVDISLLVQGQNVVAEGKLVTLLLRVPANRASEKVNIGAQDFNGATLRATNSQGGSVSLAVNAGSITVSATSIIGRYLFYDGSKFDQRAGIDSGPTDGNAIATSLEPLLPGGTATARNYSTYSRGINGIIVDIVGASNASAISASDFSLRVGTSSDTSSYSTVPASAIQVASFSGSGANGSTRVVIAIANNTIENKWLQVRTLASSPNIGLTADDVFYFGNQIGDTKNQPGNTATNAIDVSFVANHLTGFTPAGIDNLSDINRDNAVNAIDVNLVANHPSGFSSLLLITPTSSASGSFATLPLMASPPLLASREADVSEPLAQVEPRDVNRDGQVSPLDALLIINRLSSDEAGLHSNADSPLDVNGDRTVSPLDALLVINHLNTGQLAESESSSSSTESEIFLPPLAVDLVFSSPLPLSAGNREEVSTKGHLRGQLQQALPTGARVEARRQVTDLNTYRSAAPPNEIFAERELEEAIDLLADELNNLWAT